MFFLWVKTTTNVTKMDVIFNETGLPGKIIITNNGNAIPAKIELNDTYFEIINEIINNTSDNDTGTGDIARKTPNNVETPFPPLNLAKTGKI